jgi:hypothetical protein
MSRENDMDQKYVHERSMCQNGVVSGEKKSLHEKIILILSGKFL